MEHPDPDLDMDQFSECSLYHAPSESIYKFLELFPLAHMQCPSVRFFAAHRETSYATIRKELPLTYRLDKFRQQGHRRKISFCTGHKPVVWTNSLTF